MGIRATLNKARLCILISNHSNTIQSTSTLSEVCELAEKYAIGPLLTEVQTSRMPKFSAARIHGTEESYWTFSPVINSRIDFLLIQVPSKSNVRSCGDYYEEGRTGVSSTAYEQKK